MASGEVTTRARCVRRGRRRSGIQADDGDGQPLPALQPCAPRDHEGALLESLVPPAAAWPSGAVIALPILRANDGDAARRRSRGLGRLQRRGVFDRWDKAPRGPQALRIWTPVAKCWTTARARVGCERGHERARRQRLYRGVGQLPVVATLPGRHLEGATPVVELDVSAPSCRAVPRGLLRVIGYSLKQVTEPAAKPWVDWWSKRSRRSSGALRMGALPARNRSSRPPAPTSSTTAGRELLSTRVRLSATAPRIPQALVGALYVQRWIQSRDSTRRPLPRAIRWLDDLSPGPSQDGAGRRSRRGPRLVGR